MNEADLSILWRVMETKGGVIRQGRRPRRITPPWLLFNSWLLLDCYLIFIWPTSTCDFVVLKWTNCCHYIRLPVICWSWVLAATFPFKVYVPPLFASLDRLKPFHTSLLCRYHCQCFREWEWKNEEELLGFLFSFSCSQTTHCHCKPCYQRSCLQREVIHTPDEKGQTCSSNCLEIKGANNFFSVFELFKGILAHQAKWWKLFHPPLK